MGLLTEAAKRQVQKAKVQAGQRAQKKRPATSGEVQQKRPAANVSNPPLKRPAVKHEPENDCIGPEDDSHDTKLKITPEQRHVWNKALKAPENDPKAIPPVVLAEWQKATTPQMRANIIMTFCPPDVRYKDVAVFNSSHMNKFYEKVFAKSESKLGVGRTWIELRSFLAVGTLASGETAIEEGMQSGDIQKKKGLYYLVQHHLAECTTETHGEEVKGRLNEIPTDLRKKLTQWAPSHDWSAFALLDKRLLALTDADFDETVAKPPSEEAVAHLTSACERAQKLGREIRQLAQSLTRHASSLAKGNSVETQVTNAMDKLESLELMLPELQVLQTRRLMTTTDDTIKRALAKIAPEYEDCEAMANALKAVKKSLDPKVKKEGKGT